MQQYYFYAAYFQHSTAKIRYLYSHTIHTYPGPVQVNGDKGGWDGEVVDKGVNFQHEPELVRGRDELSVENIRWGFQKVIFQNMSMNCL